MSIKLKVKKKRKTVWSIIPNLKKLKVLYKPTVTMNELTDTLYNTKPYYLNDMGLSAYPNGSDVDYSRIGQLLTENSCMCGKRNVPMTESSKTSDMVRARTLTRWLPKE